MYCLTQLKVHFRPLNKVRQELCKEVQEILETDTIFTFRNLMELGLKIQFQNHDHCMDLQNSADLLRNCMPCILYSVCIGMLLIGEIMPVRSMRSRQLTLHDWNHHRVLLSSF